MKVIDYSFTDPVMNIVCDEALLYEAQKNSQEEYIRFWESPIPFVVLGRISDVNDDVFIDRAKQSIPVLRRSSGGGTVVQGPGCLNFAFVLSKHNHPQLINLSESYRYILEKVVSALQSQNIDVEFQPISDLALKSTQRKVSGNAQKRLKDFVLHHGTVLYNFELSSVADVLKEPKNRPEYRQSRVHDEFITNVALDVDQFKTDVLRHYQVSHVSNSISPEIQQWIEYLKNRSMTVIEDV